MPLVDRPLSPGYAPPSAPFSYTPLTEAEIAATVGGGNLVDRPLSAGWPAKPPNEPATNADAFMIGAGGTAVVISQIYSKEFPLIAEKISANVIGPHLALRAGIANYPAVPFRLVFLPQPGGYVPPEFYGLAPNYLSEYNKIVTDAGSYRLLPTLPESEILHTLPDNDPRTLYARQLQRSEDQFALLDFELRRASLDELFEFYRLARSPYGRYYFHDPNHAAELLRMRILGRAPDTPTPFGWNTEINPETEARLRFIDQTEPHVANLPAGGTATGAPSVFDTIQRPSLDPGPPSHANPVINGSVSSPVEVPPTRHLNPIIDRRVMPTIEEPPPPTGNPLIDRTATTPGM